MRSGARIPYRARKALTTITNTQLPGPQLQLRHTWELSAFCRKAIRELLDGAFDGDFTDTDFDHALGGLHAIITDGDVVIGHAAVVARSIVHDGRAYRVGYVEAVATDPERQRQGLGDRVMSAVEAVIDGAYDFGVLGASEAGLRLYRAHGWTPFTGRLSAMTPDGVIETADDSVHVYGRSAPVSGQLICDWRSGELW
ncbi:GNAT family N-acetyltransferase [Williamsia sp.]|uniref:GNAT family N-acetyltransferase n=1 Tax=Williamsia sp. TaxID=1872085 RepID=UPI002F952080